MKKLLKHALAVCGLRLQRLPAGIPTGHDLERDLRLVIGDKPGAVCIDAGAHHGDFTAAILSCLVRPVVHAFEPAPEVFGKLKDRHAATPGVTLVQAGLADQAGQLDLHVFSNAALNSFLPLTDESRQIFDSPVESSPTPAQLFRLDDYARTHGITQIDLLKIDTQGYELHVLRGAATLFTEERIRSVLVELNFSNLYRGQVPAHEVMGFLHGHSLQLVECYEKCRLPPHLGWCTALFTRRSARP